MAVIVQRFTKLLQIVLKNDF